MARHIDTFNSAQITEFLKANKIIVIFDCHATCLNVIKYILKVGPRILIDIKFIKI